MKSLWEDELYFGASYPAVAFMFIFAYIGVFPAVLVNKKETTHTTLYVFENLITDG
jgi:hypothetical protein